MGIAEAYPGAEAAAAAAWASLTAALGLGPGVPLQHDRLLRLHTVLGPEQLVAERVWIDEAAGPHPVALPGQPQGPAAGLSIQVDALSADTHLELKGLIAQPALLQVLTAASRTALRPFHGHVTRAALVGSNGGLARYRLTIEPWLAVLAHRVDSAIYQDLSVPELIDTVLSRHAQAPVQPAWRWALQDPSVYPKRSLCVQHEESDLAFVQRLLREEGLWCWWEHEGDLSASALGRHTLVLTDHNGGAARAEAPRVVRYTGSDAPLREDSLSLWRRERQVRSVQWHLASGDYRANALRAGQHGITAAEQGAGTEPEGLAVADLPTPYAFEDQAQAERLARRQLEAVRASGLRCEARGNWRHAAAGEVFALRDHPLHAAGSLDDAFVTLRVCHQARNNLRADVGAQVRARLGPAPAVADAARAAQSVGAGAEGIGAEGAPAGDEDAPIYQVRLVAQPLAQPARLAGFAQAAAFGARDGFGAARDGWDNARIEGPSWQPAVDPRLHPRPTVHGTQTAVVVGVGSPVHTDRDHRVKLQFHWQRGERSSHRLAAEHASNAPADDASGTWVRVAENLAGDNWGSVFVPRVGQEVLVAFIGGDVDRPVVVGALYNGVGRDNAAGNQVAGGAAGAHGSAPAWFPGDAAQGRHQGHRHAAVLSGFKSQALAHSTAGTGGYNQLVLDDSPAGQARLELSSSVAETRLQLGHLLHQADNARLAPRGHGVDLATAAWGAVRAARGALLSGHARPATSAGGLQLDTSAPAQRLQAAMDIAQGLAHTAQQHNARLAGEVGVSPATAATAAPGAPTQRLPAAGAQAEALKNWAGVEEHGAAEDAIGGGAGRVPAWAQPDLVLASPDAVGTATPQHAAFAAGRTAGFTAGQDSQWLAQKHLSTLAREGIVWFTAGRKAPQDKPNQETGIALHAASGSVSSRTLKGPSAWTAQQRIELSSTQAGVRGTAPQHVMLTAGGAAIRMEGGDITVTAPGQVEFRAGMKELAGGAAAGGLVGFDRWVPMGLPVRGPGEYDELFQLVWPGEAGPVANRAFEILWPDGRRERGITDAQGMTGLKVSQMPETLRLTLLPEVD